MISRCDLHVHSKYTDKSHKWVLRQMGVPECCTSPQDVYTRARKRGMDFVTITDYDTIAGCLEIAGRDGVFISEEISTTFPDDGCKVHILAWDINESQHKEIQKLRRDIYELHGYLNAENIVHAVAHPLYPVRESISIKHVEKLILLFQNFETLNGQRNERSNSLIQEILGNLTPEFIEELENIHDLKAYGEEPWKKGLIGGSDDHASMYIAKAYTKTDKVDNHKEFLALINERKSIPDGISGDSLGLSHSFYAIIGTHFGERFFTSQENLFKIFSDLFGDEAYSVAKWRYLFKFMKSKEQKLKERALNYFNNIILQEWKHRDYWSDKKNYDYVNKQTFTAANNIYNLLLFDFTIKLIRRLIKGSIFGGIQAVSSFYPLFTALSPYLYGFYFSHKDEPLFNQAARRFNIVENKQPMKIGWFTDTINDVNGVVQTIRNMSGTAMKCKKNITVYCSVPKVESGDFQHFNFKPIGQMDIPLYQDLSVSMPPFLEIIYAMEQEKITHAVISTPGPMGVCGLAAARMLKIPVAGIYHTDFPQYTKYLTGDDNMKKIINDYMYWFYKHMNLTYSPSEAYKKSLIDIGINENRIKLLRRGVDSNKFNPRFRDPKIWQDFGQKGSFRFLYVGRISKEKNVDFLIDSFNELLNHNKKIQLIFVGEGPYKKELQRKLRYHRSIYFTGLLRGEKLSRIYASCDCFVFPSRTDTFGNVILESLASGLPVIVSDEGGPADIIRGRDCGIIANATSISAFKGAMEKMMKDQETRENFIINGLEYMKSFSWVQIFENFWSEIEGLQVDDDINDSESLREAVNAIGGGAAAEVLVPRENG